MKYVSRLSLNQTERKIIFLLVARNRDRINLRWRVK